MKFISEEVIALGCTVTEVGGFVEITCTSHLTSLTTSHTAHFYGFRIYAEVILATIDVIGHTAAYLFHEVAHRFATIIELTAGDKIGDRRTALLQFRFKQHQFSLSISSASAAILNAMTSKSQKRGAGPGRQTFPDSITKSSENSLHISRNLTNFVYKLHITRLYNLKVEHSKLLKICDICNFFLYIF